MAGFEVTNLLDNLRRLQMHHAHLISDIDRELDLVVKDLSVLEKFPLEQQEDETRAFRVVRREIKACVYEVEDSIDAYLTQMAASNILAGFLFRRRINSCSQRKMKPLLMTIGKAKEVTGHSSTLIGGYTTRMITTLPPVQMDNVVGRDDEENTIIILLMKPELGGISIVGVGGLGKSTLARKIYVNTRIAYEFPVRIWIHISYSFFKLDDILGNILRVFTSQDIHSLSHEELSENVEACLEKKKFLLVLDNMWDFYYWEAIKNVLPKSNNMGKVLITTRVSSIHEPPNFIINLRLLDPEESWKLLRLKLFGNLEVCSPELEAVAHKCEGLPLSIILVGGILKGQSVKSRFPDPIQDVLELYENVNLDLGKRMEPFNLLEWAYRRLSEELRLCFLYMGVFPEDYEISAWTLTRLWIAEGFVRPMEGHSLEEAATHNLDDLIRMGLVMVDKINPFGKVKSCRVHAIISSFIIKKAVEQGFFHLLPPLDDYRYTCRRLCVHLKANTNSLAMVPKISGVRSVLCFNESPAGWDLNFMSAILKTTNFLKVLDSQSIKFHKLPQEITKLFHLRYVTLFVDDLNTLPKPLSKLWNLETLVVDTKSRVITMEANIWRLIWLRHLKTNAAIVLSSNNEDQSLAGGENLQTLTRLSPESCTTEVSERARNLKSLGIRGDLKILFDDKVFLGRFNLLEKLKLIHDVFPNISSENPLHQLPPPNHFPPNLKWLTLSQTHLLWDRDMPTLANIKTLQVLKLKDDAFTGVIWSESGDCFPSLNFFLIENTDLVLWKASKKLLPTLSCLVLKNCENLREIPKAVAEKLERLEIEHLGKSAVDSARRIAEQAQKKEKSNCRSIKLYIGPGCY